MRCLNRGVIVVGMILAAIVLGLSWYSPVHVAYADPQTKNDPSLDESLEDLLHLADASDGTEEPSLDAPPVGGRNQGPHFRESSAEDRWPRGRMRDRLKDRAKDRPQMRGMGRGAEERPMGRGPGREHGPFGEFLTPTEKEELMEFAKEHFPEIYERLSAARDSDPQTYDRMLRTVGRWMMDILRWHKHDPELTKTMIGEHKARMQIYTLRKQYRRAMGDSERERLEAELRTTLEKHFEYRLKRIEHEIENLRKRLEEQAQQLEERKKNKDQIIDKELKRIISDPKDRLFSY